jgi:flagellar basal-body rod modification protein FlgD
MEILPNSTRSERAVSPSAAEIDQTVITADFQTFLQLLTTQLKNQDPLNPMESTEYATQLATFSGVEQQVRTNELLESLSSGYATWVSGS